MRDGKTSRREGKEEKGSGFYVSMLLKLSIKSMEQILKRGCAVVQCALICRADARRAKEAATFMFASRQSFLCYNDSLGGLGGIEMNLNLNWIFLV